MKYAPCLALALTFWTIGLSPAGDKAPPSNYKHLKKLEPLIGTWTGEVDFPQDSPTANIKKGKYTFEVRGLNSAGTGPTTTKKFKAKG